MSKPPTRSSQLERGRGRRCTSVPQPFVSIRCVGWLLQYCESIEAARALAGLSLHGVDLAKVREYRESVCHSTTLLKERTFRRSLTGPWAARQKSCACDADGCRRCKRAFRRRAHRVAMEALQRRSRYLLYGTGPTAHGCTALAQQSQRLAWRTSANALDVAHTTKTALLFGVFV